MSGGFLAVQAKRTKERNKKVNLEDAFKEADTNNDGALTIDEWTEVLSKTGQDNPREAVVLVFNQKDRDQNGKMSFEEFSGQKTRSELAFEAIDKNGDGYVSRTEFKKICPSLTPEQCEAAFKKFDQDGTGRINYREFSSMMSRGKQDKK